ncbi:ArsR/SmtB family transcription factor [Haloarchaeobius sp. DT45]|uniref:ArsR/SmtB family transcription factor n=1 Tax=Haloarchaeobius sp. DT45 TaxID=3446116 RepID=UPI003F6C090C
MKESSLVSDEQPAADVFGALAAPTRIAILEALWEADGQEATFSELQEAVGIEDSGQFNYHLSKLRGRFVTSEDGTYGLRLAGRRIIGALLSGSYTQTGAAGPAQTDHDCPLCDDGSLTFSYESEEVHVDCDVCEDGIICFPVPPGAFAGYATDHLPDVAERYARTLLHQNRHGFCINCDGRVTGVAAPAGEIFPAVDADAGTELPPDAPFVEYHCDRCGEVATFDLRTVVATEPTVVAFHHDHGVNLEQRPLWEFFALDPNQSTVTDTDPFRAVARFTAGGTTLTVTVDDELGVLDTDRR